MDAASWDPISVDWGDPPVTPLPPVTNGPPEDQVSYPNDIDEHKSHVSYVPRVISIVFQAQNPDELSIVENEEIELMGEGDGDGWVQARNYKGEVGYIPENYIEREEEGGTHPSIPNFATFPEPGSEDASGGGLPNTVGGDGYTATEEYPAEPPPDLPPPPPPTVAVPAVNLPTLSLPVDSETLHPCQSSCYEYSHK
ncbi:hypothetical protein SK128_014162 [Halocaridina rubra]|uniref:SH3 domain-containing protein n=1 Tax=Halocaridina rubra TaxID=373956 RepID=A0AAN8XUR2_HALRR